MKKIIKIFRRSSSKKCSLINPSPIILESKFFKFLKNKLLTDFRSEVFKPLLFLILILLSQIILIKKLFFLQVGIFIIGISFHSIFGFKKYFWCLVIYVFSLASTYFAVTNVDYFTKEVSRQLEHSNEVIFSTPNLTEIKAFSRGAYSMTLNLRMERLEIRKKVKLLFTERMVWSEFPKNCINGFRCQINEGHFRLFPDYAISDYAQFFASGIVGVITLFNEKDPHAPCECINSGTVFQNDEMGKSENESVFDRLLIAQNIETNEKVKLGLSILMGTVLGEGKQIPLWTRDLFKETGLYHLLVISGYHLSVFIFLLRTLTKLCFRVAPFFYKTIPIRKLQSISAATLVFVFVANIDSGLPVWRAMITFLILLLFILIDRKIPKARLILVSLIAVETLWPLSLSLVSVQLTFAALAGIFFGAYLAEMHGVSGADKGLNLRQDNRINLVIRRFRNFILPNLFAFIFISPIQYYWFGSFSVFTLIFNLLFAFPFSLAVIGLGFVSILALSASIPFAIDLIRLQACITFYMVNLISYLNQFLKN